MRRNIFEGIIPEYDPSSAGAGGRFSGEPISEWDEARVMGAYRRHLEFWFELQFYMKNGTADEKMQAVRELEVCDGKLEFWQRHPEWNEEIAGKMTRQLAGEWEMPGAAPKRKVVASRAPSPAPKGRTVPVPDTGRPRGVSIPVTHPKLGKGKIVSDLGDGIVQVVFDRDGVARKLDRKFLTQT